MKITRNGSAAWTGGSVTGKGTLSTQSKVLSNQAYGFGSRFEEQAGTNPEELIAAAHAGCFTMFLSFILEAEKKVAEKLDTTAALTLERSPEGSFDITAVHLKLVAKVPGIDQETFDKLVATAKAGCAVSKLLNAKITLESSLIS
ncbi:OsmC family protein [Undibacterium terreum]|nr:OsmC family protein [Undibacterium terreum]